MTSSTVDYDVIVPEVFASTKMDSLDAKPQDGDFSDVEWKILADSMQIFDLEKIKQYNLGQSCKPKFLRRFFSSKNPTGNLRGATKLGKTNLVNFLLELERVYVNDTDKAGKTALHYAAREGHLEIVMKLLAELDIDPSLIDGDGNTALHIAAKHGHVLVFDKLLNARRVDVNSTNKFDETALVLAAKRGHKKIVNMLLNEPDVVINLQYFDTTPFHVAIQHGHAEIVGDLLKKWDVNSTTHSGKKSLAHLALKKGYETVLKKIPAKKIPLEDDNGATLLHLAVESGHETVVEELLKIPTMKPSLKDRSGNTPLHIAAEKGNGVILEKLLENMSKEDITSCNEKGMTALHVATQNNRANIIPKLLEKSKVDPWMKTTKDKTPLLCMASKFGAIDVVQVLLTTRNVDVNITDSKERTAIRWASKRRHFNIVDVLLNVANINLWLEDDNDNTLLHFATKHGHRGIVERLLAKSPLDVVNKVNKQKETPFLLAARHGFENVVDLFLENPKVDLSICDENGDSPFHVAVKGGHANIAKKLMLHLKAVPIHNSIKANLKTEDASGNFPIHYVVQMGNTSILQMILEAGVDVNSVNDHRDTALHIAVRKGHIGVVEILLEASKILASKQDGDGNCPLHVAALYDEEEMIERLLKVGVNVNIKNEDGEPALVLAAQEGHVFFVDKLLENKDLELISEHKGSKTDWGVCSLLRAARNGHDKVIKSLLEHGSVNVNGSIHSIVGEKISKFRQDTALSEAIKNGHKRVVKELLRAPSIDPNRRNENGEHPLFIAARHGHLEIVEMLLGKKPSDVNAISSGGTTLQGAMQEGREKVTKTLPNPNGETTLHGAIQERREHVMKTPLKLPKIDVNVISNGQTVLQGAARAGREQVTKTLPNPNGETTLHGAIQERREHVMKTPLKLPKIDVNVISNGQTVLQGAARAGREQVVKTLLKIPEIDVHFKNPRTGESVLFDAARANNKTILKDVYEKRKASVRSEKNCVQKLLDINDKNNEGNAIIHLAAEGGLLDVLDFLVEVEHDDVNSVNVNLKNSPLKDEENEVTSKSALKIAIEVAEILDDIATIFANIKAKHVKTIKKLKKDDEKQMFSCISFIQKQKKEGQVDAQSSLETAMKDVDVATTDIEWWAEIQAQQYKAIEKLAKFQSINFIQEKEGQEFLQHIFDGEQWETFSIITRAPQVTDYIESLYKDRQASVDAANAILVGATLIAGVTFASWLQPPLGYSTYYHEQFSDSLPAPPIAYPEYVAFDHHPSLQAFWVFNALSFFSAIATVIFGARSVLPTKKVFIKKQVENLQRNLIKTSILFGLSMFFVLLAFATAGVVVLPPMMKFRANIFSTIGIGGSVCFVCLFLFGRSIYKLVYIYNESSQTNNMGFFRRYFIPKGWTYTFSNIKSSITDKMAFFR